MEGDEDWVSTSPIKLAVPPARKTFTPGRVLSRDEIRQQRRRGADHVLYACKLDTQPVGSRVLLRTCI